jgi:molybdopterin-guanine dinucleotide biosynthesis protein A
VTLGVLLAGGAGSRLGLGVPKALARVGDSTLLERGVRTLAELCGAIVVVAPGAFVLPLPAAGAVPVSRVLDPPEAAGPLAGMVAGLSSRDFARAIVLGVDFPLMTPATLRVLLARLDEARVAFEAMACGARAIEAVIAAPGGIAQPLAAAYAPAARDVLARRLALGERAPSRAIASLQSIVLDDAAIAKLPGGREAFFNLNTPADLDEARRRVTAGAARP